MRCTGITQKELKDAIVKHNEEVKKGEKYE